ncbi:phosphatase PAP2 family protein [Kutzneria sp. CA-103260]|uniref:phosphatase PAP2 family protein n=1 Tax=Kutzneria sp. CA-103260 TaxID=2802641 RepID=UPI001BA8CA2B|nr:phosphatase PAP2 family protein [Kutzneria sp. CA-103260]QUQ63812.1 PAP2 superfamily protein [Kutzneria sp. CA-103260]
MKATIPLVAASLVVTLAVAFSFAPMIGVDQAVAVGLHRYAVGHSGVVTALQVWTDVFGPWTFRGLLVVAAAWLWWRRRVAAAVWVVVTVLAAAAMDSGLKALVGRERPHWTDPVSHAVGASFPSGHSLTSAMGCAVLLVLAWPRVCQIGVIVAVAVPAVTGFTRLALGVHFLSDVVGGWLLGVTVVAVVTSAARWRSGRSCPSLLAARRSSRRRTE